MPMPWSPSPATESSLPSSSFSASSMSATASRRPAIVPAAAWEAAEPLAATVTAVASVFNAVSSRWTSPTEPLR